MMSTLNLSKTERHYNLLIALLIALNALALFGELMEPDAALYASIAKTIALTNDWTNLYVNSVDWLDKPHFTFWLAALSFKIFGISAFAYKLPSFIIGLVGCYYLFRLAKTIFNQRAALLAVIILLSALHNIISTTDVRAEVYLSTFILAAIYHFYRAQNSGYKHILAGALFAAFAVMVKGIFVLIPVFGGFIIYWLYTKQFSEFLKLKWYGAIALVLLFMLPELYTLYVQFDLHPEKIVFGETKVSGLQFFFWDSQFGRFFNNGPIKGCGEPSFFFHTTLWAFLPWSLAFVAAVVQLGRKQVRRMQKPVVIIIWGSAAITFLIFSLSRFQLPHYIIIIFPQFAMITSNYLISLDEKQERIFGKIHTVLGIIVIALLVTLAYFFKIDHLVIFYILAAILIFTVIAIAYQQNEVLVKNAVGTSIAMLLFLFLFFYPTLLKYQAGLHAAKWLNQHQPTLQSATFEQNVFAFDFYTKGIVKHLDLGQLPSLQNKSNYVFYVQGPTIVDLQKAHQIEVLAGFDYFRITKLKPKFINAKTREQVLGRFYLVKIK